MSVSGTKGNLNFANFTCCIKFLIFAVVLIHLEKIFFLYSFILNIFILKFERKKYVTSPKVTNKLASGVVMSNDPSFMS